MEDQRLLRKFCLSLDRHIGCKGAYGVNQNCHSQCETCPLSLAEQAMFLMNYKGMTLGEAVKATVRRPLPPGAGQEICAGLYQAKKDYPELKDNEERAAASVINGGDEPEEED